MFIAYKYSICDIFSLVLQNSRIFATEPIILIFKTVSNKHKSNAFNIEAGYKMQKMCHLDLTKDKIKNSKIALFIGDPFRVQKICTEIMSQYGRKVSNISWKGEYKTNLCEINNSPIVVTSSGVGGPSLSIAVEELAMLGIGTFIRIGTTSAIQGYISTGDVIITTGSVRMDGASKDYAPIEYPAIANYEIINSLINGAIKSHTHYHAGITVSTDTFYPGQEKNNSFNNYVIKKLQGTMQEWKALKVLSYEMESATLLTMCSIMGLRGGCITGVIGNREWGENILDNNLQLGVNSVIKASVASLEYIFKN